MFFFLDLVIIMVRLYDCHHLCVCMIVVILVWWVVVSSQYDDLVFVNVYLYFGYSNK